MPLTVNIEQPPGTIVGVRRFEPGAAIRVSGKLTSWLSLGEPLQAINLQINPSDGGVFDPIYLSTNTNLMGNYWFDVTLPSVGSKADLVVIGTFADQSTVQTVVPIAIGSFMPDTPPSPGDNTLMGVAKVVAIAGGVIAVAWMLSKSGLLSKGERYLRERRNRPALPNPGRSMGWFEGMPAFLPSIVGKRIRYVVLGPFNEGVVARKTGKVVKRRDASTVVVDNGDVVGAMNADVPGEPSIRSGAIVAPWSEENPRRVRYVFLKRYYGYWRVVSVDADDHRTWVDKRRTYDLAYKAGQKYATERGVPFTPESENPRKFHKLVHQPKQRRKFDGQPFVLTAVETQSVAEVLARQMRQTDRLVRLQPVAGNRVAIYTKWKEGH